MAVSEDDGVDSPNAVRQRLFAQVRPGVHEHGRSVVERDEDRRAAAGDRASRSIDRCSQSQPIIGTPLDVPVPRKVIFRAR